MIRPLILAALLAACVSISEDTSFRTVQHLAEPRVEARVHLSGDTEADAQAAAEVRRLLDEPLTADAAVQVALLANPALQARLQRLAIARADLVEAATLRNPSLSGSVKAPGAPVNLELGLVQDLLDSFVRPSRVALARTQLEGTELSVAAEVVAFTAEVRSAWVTALGAQQVAALRRLVVEAAEASADLARRLQEAGNTSDLQLVTELASYEEARIAWARAESERRAAREALASHLGLWDPSTEWTLPDGLPEVPREERDLGGLEEIAIERRLDLAAAQKGAEALAQALGLTRDWRFLGLVDLGVSTERDSGESWTVGPELSLELPLFDREQGALARLAAELRRADHEVVALAIDVRTGVRVARDRLIDQQRLVRHLREVVIPLREAAVTHTQAEYDFMLVGAFELIAARKAEYDAYQEYVEAVRDYWLARTDLEAATGGLVDTAASGPDPIGGSHHAE